jgi:hypothetical protein
MTAGLKRLMFRIPSTARHNSKNACRHRRNMDIRAEFHLRKGKSHHAGHPDDGIFPLRQERMLPGALQDIPLVEKPEKKDFRYDRIPYITLDVIKNTTRFFQYTRFYDKIFIHTPKRFEYPFFIDLVPDDERRRLYASIFETLKDKIIHTGYILPEYEEGLTHAQTEKLSASWKRSTGTRLLVSRGGGTTCPKIIAASILAQKYLKGAYPMLLSCGPATGKKEMSFFKGLIRKHRIKNTIIVPYLPHFGQYLKACDISISLAGYNTSAQLLRFGKKCIVIPYTVLARSAGSTIKPPVAMLEKYLNARLLDMMR